MRIAANSEIKYAVIIGGLMHIALFVAMKPAGSDGLIGALVPPKTHYLANASDRAVSVNGQVRTVWSPVVFALPSNVGFSRTLYNDNLRTRLSFTQKNEAEHFLEVGAPPIESDMQSEAKGLMLTRNEASAPALPDGVSAPEGPHQNARRVSMAPELMNRLVGGIVLPPELNRPPDSAWQVNASVRISSGGMIEHVFLEQPMESQSLNMQILQLLYGLKFKSGTEPVEGMVEIYSPGLTGHEVAP